MEMAQYLWGPLIVSLLSGIVLYVLKTLRFRKALLNGLIIEINILLKDLEHIKSLLSSDNNLWLKEGAIIKEVPLLTFTENKIFNSYLSNMYLLNERENKLVLQFYAEIDNCIEMLKIFFKRIKDQSENNLVLTNYHVKINKLRSKRIQITCGSICRIKNLKIERIYDLPDFYEEADLTEIDNEILQLKLREFEN
jgi:hypothetical protein